jgi:hypothetical protein
MREALGALLRCWGSGIIGALGQWRSLAGGCSIAKAGGQW